MKIPGGFYVLLAMDAILFMTRHTDDRVSGGGTFGLVLFLAVTAVWGTVLLVQMFSRSGERDRDR